MGENSKIGWTDHTFNPWWGCTRVSPGCQHCYAETFAKRTGNRVWGKDAPRRFLSDKHWNEPRRWNASAEESGVRARVFCASMADVFEDRRDLDEHRARLWDLIAATPMLDWQLLTKRPEQIENLIPDWWLRGDRGDWEERTWNGPPNVWLGTTVEDQQRADDRVPWLLSLPAPVRFLSCEPLLCPVDLASINVLHQSPDDWPQVRLNGLNGAVTGLAEIHPWSIDWVICGGESGPGHRPLNLDHARSLRDQCAATLDPIDETPAPVPFFFKQVGGQHPTSGGDLLDGVRHQQFPQVAR